VISELQRRTPPDARGMPLAEWLLKHGVAPVSDAEKRATLAKWEAETEALKRKIKRRETA
jgi:hypothetical protein